VKHIFLKGSDLSSPTFILFHGTGGTEKDLLPLAQQMNSSASILSVRGNVLENGMPRFFRRLAEGVFDEEDLIVRTQELNVFLDQAAIEYEFDRHNMVAIGYSNGANIAGSLMFHYQDALQGAILHHPMVPRRGIPLPDLSETPVFIGAGRNDPICAPQETEELESLLVRAGSSVNVHWEHFGHQLTRSEIDAAAEWYRKHFGERDNYKLMN
jgi:phospholipase/carboxylesterase